MTTTTTSSNPELTPIPEESKEEKEDKENKEKKEDKEDKEDKADKQDKQDKNEKEAEQPQKGDASETPSASSNTLTPLTENKKNQKKEKSNVVCSFSTAVLLFLLAAASVLLAGFAAYWFTRQKFEMKMAEMNYVPQPMRNMSLLSNVEEMYEEEAPTAGPSADELRLPANVEPVWYNLTLKTYLPGVSAMPDEKNLTTDGNIMIKLNVRSTTDTITLNAKDLTFPADPSKVRILTDVVEMNKFKREAINETEAVEENPEELINMTAKTELPEMPAMPIKKPELQGHGAIVKQILYNATIEKVVLVLDKALQSGEQVIVQMPFSGRITDNADGLHRSSYRTKNGDKKIISFTNISPGSTRSIYPSLDEPQYQAPLSLTILHPKGTIARSNAKEILDSFSVETEPLWDKTSFEATSSVPSYLTGFTVSDFGAKEAMAKNGIRVRIYARPEAANSTTYALETAAKVIDLLQDYFGVPLSNNKQDIFAIPAMEESTPSGPGFILLPEEDLLVDPSAGIIEEKVKVARALSRELTRQWFGNLVAPADWHALWLNEAVAKYMEYFLMEKLFDGNIDSKSYLTSESFERALVNDARSSSHPLTLNIETNAEAQEITDQLTGEKGAALLRMFEAVIGEETFQKGVQSYLQTHANGNANYTDFWDALDKAIDGKLKTWDGNKFTMEEFAENWVLQMGYPVVDIYRLDPKTVELTQRRFKLDHLTPERARYRNAVYWYKWDVPLFYEINDKKKDMVWLHEAVRLPLNLSDTLLVNPESLGYYRVNYDEQGWLAIADQLKKDHQKYPASARARLISDALALAEAGLLPYEQAFRVIEYLPQETDTLPWAVALKGLRNLYERLSRSELEEEAQKFIVKKVAEIFKTIDLDSLDAASEGQFLDSDMKKHLAELYCELSPEDCSKKLETQFETNFMAACNENDVASDCSKVNPFIRPWVYCSGVAEGGHKEFERIYKLYTKEVNAAEKKRLLEALTCSRDPRHLRKLLHEVVHSQKSAIPNADVQTLVESMNRQPVGAEIVSDFVLDNWKDLVERFSMNKATLSDIVRKSIRLDSERDVKQFERFIADHKSTTASLRALKLPLEKARNQVHWLKMNRKTMKDLLSSETSEKEL